MLAWKRSWVRAGACHARSLASLLALTRPLSPTRCWEQGSTANAPFLRGSTQLLCVDGGEQRRACVQPGPGWVESSRVLAARGGLVPRPHHQVQGCATTRGIRHQPQASHRLRRRYGGSVAVHGGRQTASLMPVVWRTSSVPQVTTTGWCSETKRRGCRWMHVRSS